VAAAVTEASQPWEVVEEEKAAPAPAQEVVEVDEDRLSLPTTRVTPGKASSSKAAHRVPASPGGTFALTPTRRSARKAASTSSSKHSEEEGAAAAAAAADVSSPHTPVNDDGVSDGWEGEGAAAAGANGGGASIAARSSGRRKTTAARTSAAASGDDVSGAAAATSARKPMGRVAAAAAAALFPPEVSTPSASAAAEEGFTPRRSSRLSSTPGRKWMD
jgi:hypothetical protein